MGFAGNDVAEAATAGADVAEDHKGGSRARPALSTIGAGCRFTDRMQVVLFNQTFDVFISGSRGKLDFEPLWLGWFDLGSVC